MNTCPDCGAPVIPILYGYPTAATFRRANRGEIRLAGCVLTDPDMDNGACTVCDWVGRLDV